jgi:hypothetical protein
MVVALHSLESICFGFCFVSKVWNQRGESKNGISVAATIPGQVFRLEVENIILTCVPEFYQSRVGIFVRRHDLLAEFLYQPSGVVALLPFFQVLPSYGAALEVFGQNGLHLWKPVEPDDEANMGFTAAEAGMEFFEDMGREPADFAITFHILPFI